MTRHAGRQAFLDDQFAAAAETNDLRLRNRATSTVVEYTEDQLDLLTRHFTDLFRVLWNRGLERCAHYDVDAPAPLLWDSALPVALFCQDRCNPLTRDFQLRARSLLPAVCGSCGSAPGSLRLQIAYGSILLICRVCAPCMAKMEAS